MALRKKKKAEKRGSSIRLIVKSNNLVEARYMMNIWESRVFIQLLSMIKESDGVDEVYRVWFKDIKNKFSLKSNTSYEDLREGAIGLTRKTVYLDWTTEDDFDRQITTHLVEGVDVLKSGQEHKKGVERQQYIDLKLGSTIKPHLLEIKRHLLSKKVLGKDVFNELGISGYTSYDMRNVVNLKPYSIRLFEILKKHERNGFWTVEVDRFKKMFMIDNEYKRFVHFFQAVVERSVKDINEYTDVFVFNIDKIKKGRKVTRLKFDFRSKTIDEINVLHQGEEKELIKEEIVNERKLNQTDVLYQEFEEIVVRSFGVTPTVFINMLNSKKYTKAAIQQAIEVTRRAKFNQEIKKSLAGFFIKALQKEFTDVKIEQKKKVVSKKRREADFEKLEKEYLIQKADKIKWILETVKGVRKKTMLHLKKNPSKALNRRLSTLNLSIENATIDDFREDKILRSLFINAVANLYKEYLSEIDAAFEKKVAALHSINRF